MARTTKNTKTTNKKNIREAVLKTELGKNTYKKLTISTLFLIISLLGVAIIMTWFCKYCMNGGNWDDLQLAFTLFPIFSTMSFITGATTCFLSGEFTGIMKTHKK